MYVCVKCDVIVIISKRNSMWKHFVYALTQRFNMEASFL